MERYQHKLPDGIVDYIGISYYLSNTVSASERGERLQDNLLGSSCLVKNPHIASTELGWSVDPTGLRYFLNMLNNRYNLPIFIVENGFGANDVLTPEEGNGSGARSKKRSFQWYKNVIATNGDTSQASYRL